MADYNFWNLICKLKNYYNGNRCFDKKKSKELSGRISMGVLFCVFNFLFKKGCGYIGICFTEDYWNDEQKTLPYLLERL